MYYAWHEHHILPSVYKGIGYGERKIINVFMNKEIEDHNAQVEEMNK